MFLTTQDVMNRYKISRSTLYRWECSEDFPQPKNIMYIVCLGPPGTPGFFQK